MLLAMDGTRGRPEEQGYSGWERPHKPEASSCQSLIQVGWKYGAGPAASLFAAL